MLQANRDKHSIWAHWLFIRSVTRKQRIQYACYAATLVLPIYEKMHPGCTSIRDAISAARACIYDDSEENRKMAHVAYFAAAASAYRAESIAEKAAANVASNAAYIAFIAYITDYADATYVDAASEAAYASYIDAFAEDSYADDSYFYASESANKTNLKIIKYGISLLNE